MKNIVVIDDDRDVRDVIVFALENEGFNVQSFENGKSAILGLEKLDALPSLIIVDYLMPEMDGVSFINHVRKNFPEKFLSIPIALSSAMGSQSPEFAALKDLIHLSKPMDLEDLLELAREHCS